MADRLFGTDGVRGRAGEGWLREDRAALLARAIGTCLAADGDARRALIGHDGRRSGPGLERAVARGLRAAGLEPVILGLTTTPGLALLTRLGDFGVGLMISASHNPAEDNGVKVFDAQGAKLPDEVEDRVEALVAELEPVADDGSAPSTEAGLEQRYVEHLLDHARGLDLAGLTIALDCAHGGGSRVAPRVLEALGARVVSIAADPDGSNINDGCGSTHPDALQAAVREHRADLGVALDGDGDRCLLVNEHGELIDGDAMLTLLALDLKQRGELPSDRIVATVMSNKGLHRALGDAQVGVTTVGVGDRRVVEALRAESLGLGGEQSGHIVFGPDNHFIGDGTLTALRVLRAMRTHSRSIGELASVFSAFPQVLVNTRVASKPAFETVPAVLEAVAECERELGDDGRVLLRYSGTEPLARVMVEGPDQERIRAMAEALAELVAAELGS
ncbi:MAG: phosphoglucosamine mutase [Planctomycetota bacterium]